jgi:acetyl esterase/lipase
LVGWDVATCHRLDSGAWTGLTVSVPRHRRHDPVFHEVEQAGGDIMSRVLPWLLLSLIAVLALAASAAKVQTDIAYSDAGGNRTRLDVYAPGDGEDHPVVIWVHGGAWQFGDKADVQSKPRAFNERGYVLVSVNYRLHSAVTYKEQAGDIAQAIRWVKDHAREHGGDPGRVFLMGHSAGAHLAALVGTDGRYLGKAGLKLGDLAGVILLDGACYDIPRQIRQTWLPRMKAMYTKLFTEDEATQRDASPITHVARGKSIPPFLILHVAGRRDAKAQAEGLAARLREAGVVPAERKTHVTINRGLGEPDDAPTGAVFEFLRGRCAETGTR